MPKPTIRLAMELVYGHNRVTRLTHWIDGIMRRVQPNPEAQYVVFHCYGYRRPRNSYYESIDLIDASPPRQSYRTK